MGRTRAGASKEGADGVFSGAQHERRAGALGALMPSVALLAALLITNPATTGAGEDASGGVEVVRVKRDFGKPHVDLVIDAWTDAEATRLVGARLWWVLTREQDRRKPLGPVVERMVKLEVRRESSTQLVMTVTGDRKQFAFTVELGADGKSRAFVAVDTEEGRFIPRCRVEQVTLVAHRVLGVPVGLERIAVRCNDGGQVHRGQIRHRAAAGA